jgi:hypothetical protein
MKYLNLTAFVLLIFLFAGVSCKKQTRVAEYTITGRVLESIANPIPVKSYTMHLYRKERSGFTGWIPGISKDFKTDNSGNFSVTYTVEKGTGLGGIANSEEALTITGFDAILYPNVSLQLFPVPANKDTSFNTVYIY